MNRFSLLFICTVQISSIFDSICLKPLDCSHRSPLITAMFPSRAIGALVATASIASIAVAQQPGTLKTEGNPTISVKECDANGCSQKDHKLVLDANWRWIHTDDSQNCYTGNMWDDSICADGTTCAAKCQVEAVDAGD